jgi:hypothetical protein
MYSIYFFNYWKEGDRDVDVSKVLKRYGELPDDFDERFVKCDVDPPEISKDDEHFRFCDFCPEVNLFQPGHSPSFEPGTALSSLSYETDTGIKYKEYKHFSECLEYIKNTPSKPQTSKRTGLSPKKRFAILERDEFTCQYCGKQAKAGAVLHVDHKTSVHDDGTNDSENLITSCDECNFGKGKKSINPNNNKAK